MIHSMKLTNFKSFSQATIELTSLTTFIGTNGSGKSNIKDALRLLHGISRGYSLSEAIGEKWGEGGVSEWKGIRGGTREMLHRGSSAKSCIIEIEFGARTVPLRGFQEKSPRRIKFDGIYTLEISLSSRRTRNPKILSERLRIPDYEYNYGHIFLSDEVTRDSIKAECGEPRTSGRHRKHMFRNDKPILTQFVEHEEISEQAKQYVRGLITVLRKMRFLDLSPDAMRQASLPGQRSLSDHGENLSSVLQSITQNETKKQTLIKWLTELTPHDIVNIDFLEDSEGKVTLYIVEATGNAISAHSTSDGTLRYLAMLAALFSSVPAQSYFIEEIENGIHPARLRLITQLMKQNTEQQRDFQLILTTHSPLLLEYVASGQTGSASLVYRVSNSSDSKVVMLSNIPGFPKLPNRVSDLHATNWFENVMEFLTPGEEEEVDNHES